MCRRRPPRYKHPTQANHVRADGSTHHIVYYDSATGQVIGYSGGQGKSVDSCWSRGLAWGLTGFTIVYRETSDPNMLAAAKKLADYFVGHLPADGIPYADFDDPSGSKDSSAAAIAASGLLELSTLAGDPDYRLKYYKCAKNILVSLCTKISYQSKLKNAEKIVHNNSIRNWIPASAGMTG